MSQLPREFQRYLDEAMGLRVVLSPYAGQQTLPHFIQQFYELYEVSLASRHLLVLFLREGEEITPTSFNKHLRQLPLNQYDGYCLVAREMSGYVRKRLIEKGIPFVVPGSQLYWPALGMAIQARGGGRHLVQPVELLSPATQVVVVHALLAKSEVAVTPKTLAERLAYTPMTMSRALDEIESTQLGTVSRVGRERLLHFPSGTRTLWRLAKERMRSPVRETVRIWERDLPEVSRLLAGESALARRTMLGHPKIPVYAVGREVWRDLMRQKIEILPIDEPGSCLVEIWRYDPQLTAQNGCVDPFSLFLSLRDVRDERVEAALDEMMEQLQWW